jgi:ECF transporter S component (folate family)
MIAVMAMLIAVSIILSRLLGFYITPSLRISFEYFPIILAGILFGPICGGIVGALADFLGAILFGIGFFPPLTVGPILAGVIAGIIAKLIFKGDIKWWKIVIASCVADLLGNYIWGSLALHWLYHSPFFVLLGARLPVKLAVTAVDAFLNVVLVKALIPVVSRWYTRRKKAR